MVRQGVSRVARSVGIWAYRKTIILLDAAWRGGYSGRVNYELRHEPISRGCYGGEAIRLREGFRRRSSSYGATGRSDTRGLYTFLRNEPNFLRAHFQCNGLFTNALRRKLLENDLGSFSKTNPIWGVF